MKLSLNWLKDFVDVNISADELAEKLTNSGFEVEEIINPSKGMETVFVGKIVKITKHPNAERLSVCDIDMGDRHLQILTAATNVFEGAYVPVATDGSLLPCGTTIKTTNMRGLESQGMLCSGYELCIDNKVYEGAEVDGIMILKDVEIGENIASVLGLDDIVLDITILGNRPDCNSVYGLAREISTMLNLPLKKLDLDYDLKEEKVDFDIKVNTPNCLRYMGAVVKDVELTDSPKWMQARLKAVGINPINNIVDITNYVLMEIGQPMHAFDFDKVDNIIVRQADNEKLVALNDVEYQLNQNDMVIADSTKPLVIAGVMGGSEASVSDGTKNVLFESASFSRASIRTTSKKLSLRSDSSARYERGVEPTLNEIGLNRALHLISSLKIGKIVSIKDRLNCEIKENVLTVDYNKINALLGTNISKDKIQKILNSLNITTTINGDNLICNIPNYRTDIECLADIAEEVIRICGLEEIQVKQPTVSLSCKEYDAVKKIRETLVQSGLFEIKTFSLGDGLSYQRLKCEKDNIIEISNPLNDNLKALRTNLIDDMLHTISFNLNHGNKGLRLFEVGRKYMLAKGEPKELDTLCVALTGKVDFFELKKLLFKVTNLLNVNIKLDSNISFPYNKFCAGNICLNDEKIGTIGNIHPLVSKNYGINEDVYVLELELDKILLSTQKLYQYQPISKYPAVIRDLNFLVPNGLSYEDINSEIVHSSGKYCKEVTLVDIYAGNQIEEGYKSLSFRLKFEKDDATLTDQEVEQAVARLLRTLEYKLKVYLRR